MATVIDTLAIEIGVDAANLIAQLRSLENRIEDVQDTGEAAGQKIQAAFSRVADGLRNARAVAAEFIATVGSAYGINKLIGMTVEAGNAAQLMSKKLGMSATELTAWGRAAELAGGTSDGMIRSLESLARAHTELALTGNTAMLPYLSMLGVSIGDAQGRMRDFDDILLDLADRFSQMDSRHAYNIGAAMGLDDSTINLLIRGRVEVEQMVKRQKEFGAVSKEEAERGRRVNEVLTKGRQTMEAMGRSIGSALMPFVEILVRGLDDLNRWVVKNEQSIRIFAIALSALAAAIAPVNLGVVAITALAGAIALLWDDYQTWKMGADSFIDWAKWKPGLDAAKYAMTWLRDLLKDMIYRAIAFGDMIGAIWEMDWDRLDRATNEWIRGTGEKYGGEKPRENADTGGGNPSARLAEPGTKWEELGGEQSYIGRGYTGTIQRGGAIDLSAPAGESKRGGDTDAPAPAGESKRDRAVRYFMGQGWTREQAIGITANLQHESNFNERSQGDKDPRSGQYKAFGIAQWHPDRQREFKRVFDKDIRDSTYEEQLAFVHHELTTTEQAAGQKLRAAKTAQEAGAAVSRYYERPLRKDAEAAARGKTAQAIAGEYAAQTASAAPDGKNARGGAVESAAGDYAAYTAAAAPGAGGTTNNTTNNRTVTANIGEINVQTQATDAQGIAADIGTAMNETLVSQMNYGTF